MKSLASTLAFAATLALAACNSPEAEPAAMDDELVEADAMAEGTAAAPGTVVELAQGNADLSTLVSAVQSAGLVETLSGPGPFTVFAPANAAFAKVPQSARDQLMSPGGKKDLTGILTYHVVAGETMSGALIDAIESAGDKGYAIKTVNGATLTAMLDGGRVVLTDGAGGKATVMQADVDASNGVVHVIDGVLMPK